MTRPLAAPAAALEDLLASQRAAFVHAGAPTLAERRLDLRKLRAAVIAHRSEIERALNADFGHRSRHETAMIDIMTPVQGIDYLLRRLRRFMRPERRHVGLSFRFASARVQYQPLGVIGIVSPWNYPLGHRQLATSRSKRIFFVRASGDSEPRDVRPDDVGLSGVAN